MSDEFVPKIKCRFKIRQDLDGFIGFFQGKGVLIFNEIGAFIVRQMNGEKSIREIKQSLKESFPEINNHESEVNNVIEQLRESEFF
jgi:hypothetical protein